MTGLPADFSTSNVLLLVVELAFVLVLLAGLVATWSWLRGRVIRHEAPFWVVAAEAVLAVPWVLFPLLFLLSWAGAHRVVLIATQIALAVAGAAWIWERRTSVRPALEALPRALRADLPYAAALLAVALFVLWGWVMPFPEAFNGHQHDLVNLLRHMWDSGEYDLLAPAEVGYDNNILIWPAPFATFLSLFTVQGIDDVGLRPMFLLPGIGALLTLQLLRATARELGHESAGSIAFLLVAFSYYASSDFTDITFDLLAPLLLTYFGYHAARWAVRGQGAAYPFLLVLAVSFLIRRQVFLIVAAALLALVVLRLVPWRAFVPRATGGRAALAALLVAPALLWAGVMWGQYESPFFPHETSLSGKVFKSPYQPAQTTNVSLGTGFDTQKGPVDRVRDFFETRSEGHRFPLTHYLPVYKTDGSGLVKNAFAGVSLSVLLTLATIGFLLGAGRVRGLGLPPGRARLLLLAYGAGFLVVGYQFFGTYPKFPHYLSFLIAPFAALLLLELARRIPRGAGPPLLAVGLLAVGGGLWAVNTWGHAAWDSKLSNVKFLVPGYGSATERLARDSGRSTADLEQEAAEYQRAVASRRGRILHMEHEPGALVPALLDREFLGEVLYVENPRARPVLDARTKPAMLAALRRLGVAYVYRPGRGHPPWDDRPIFRETREHRGPTRFVIPIDEL
jgi:hypothetical protein